MTLQALIAGLKQLGPADPVRINAELLGSDALMALLRDGLRSEEIAIEQPQIAPMPLDPSATSVTIAGSAAFLDLEDIDVVAELFEEGGTLQMRLSAALPPGWSFGDSFPNLAGYLSLNSLDYGYRESYLNVLDFARPTLVLSSTAYSAADPASDIEIAYAPGLNFKAYLSLTGLLEPLALLAGTHDPLLITGLLLPPGQQAEAGAEFQLSAIFPLSLGVEAFQFKNPRITLYSGFADRPAAPAGEEGATGDDAPLEEIVDAAAAVVSRVEIGAELAIAGRSVELSVGVPLGVPLDLVAIGARSDVLLPSLGDIAALVGDADLEGALPDSLQSFGGLKIEQFIAGFSVAQRALDYVMLDVSSADSWTIIPDALAIETLFVRWLLTAPLRAAERRMRCVIDGQLKIADVALAMHAELPDFLISGKLAEGSTIKLGALLAHFIPSIPAPDESLVISQLSLLANPKFKTFNIATTINNIWPIPLGFTDLQITSLDLAFAYAPQSKNVDLAGQLHLLDIDWSVAASYQSSSAASSTGGRPLSSSSWVFAGQLAEGERVLLPDLVNEVITHATGDTIELPDSLAGLALTDLAFRVDTGASKEYGFQGAFRWDFEAADLALTAQASLKIRSWLPSGTPTPARQYEGAVSGAISFENIDLDFFQHFAVSATYTFRPGSKALSFTLKKNALELTATFASVPAPSPAVGTHSLITVDFGKSSFGDLLTFMAQLVDPSMDEFTLDPPWDELNTIDLDKLVLKINLTTKEVTIGVPINKSFFGGLVEIQRFDLSYVRLPDGKKTVMIGLVGGLMGEQHGDDSPKSWDALNQPPPAVAGKGSAIFDLDYLGLGQHVAFRTVEGLDNITKVMTALRAAVVDLPMPNSNPLAVTGELLRFDAASGWLIGAQFTVIGTVSLAVIFNDPLIYGVRIELAGAKAKIFAGLAFEILYRRISDTIGVYHIELVLPEAMRQLEFGAVSVTLPVVVVDIYTNGDFKLDFGFPWKGDFSRSFAIDAFPFTGAGGFYFNKLSAATATSVPAISTSIGVFNPVIEFGLGLKIGLGKTFNKGVLKAELSISVQGVLEGVIAWFNPSGASGATDQYYMIKGGVAIVGRLWGLVDFEIIQVEIEVLARAMVLFKVEAYQPIYITLSVEVSVRASIKILFIRIHFSFSLTISQSFVLGSHRTAPWELPARAAARMAFAAAVLGETDPPALHWTPARLFDSAQTIDIYFQPAFTRDAAGVQGLALLFVENGIPLDADAPADLDAAARDTTRDFDTLALAMLEWAIRAHTALDAGALTQAGLQQLHDMLVAGQDDPAQPFDFAHLVAFLGQNFVFRIADRPPAGSADLSGTIFPIFPQLAMKVGDAAPVAFSSTNMLSAAARQGFADYFRALRASHGDTVERDTPEPAAAAPSASTLSAATFIFADYFALLARSTVQIAIDYMRDNSLGALALADLLVTLRSGTQLNHLAGMVSRFLLHGLRLPWAGNPASPTTPLYQLTGQQFAVAPAAADALVISFSKPADPAWIRFLDYDDAGKATPSATALRYSLAPGLAGLARGLVGADPRLNLAALQPLPYYTPAPRHFTIEHRTEWQAVRADGQLDAQLFDMPEALSSYLATAGAAGAALTLHHGAPAAGSELKQADIRQLTSYDWATRVRIHVRKVPAPGGAAMLPQTYLLVGADESGKDLLEELWSYLQRSGAQAQLSLLYASKANAGLASQLPAESLLIKTNLSTQANPSGAMLLGDAPTAAADSYAASLEQSADFIRLVWECSSVSSGGYFLYYAADASAGLPEDAFADGLSASLELLVVLNRQPGAAPAAAYSFQNSLVAWERLEMDGAVLFAQSGDTVSVLSVPAGHVGFRLERPMPPAPAAAPDAANELSRAYQLLGYRLQARPGFRASGEGLPVGPAPDDPNSSADDGLWIYERMVPVYRFADNQATAQAGLPAPADNPYAGIRLLGAPDAQTPASAAIELFWQDVYGNRLQPSGELKLVRLRYFDPLLSINQWPSVAESYWFAPASDPSAVLLNIELAFDTTPYGATDRSAAELGQKISAARAIYERVYYQVHQPDLSFAISTSALPSARRIFGQAAPEAAQISGFVDAAYRYLSALEHAQPATPPASARLVIELPRGAATNPAYPDAPIFPVVARIELRRDPALVDPAAALPEVQAISAVLKPSTTAGADDEISSLRQFARTFEQAFAGLHLAVGNAEPHKHSARADTPDEPAAAPLWAVQLGQQGISYNIHEELPFFFTPAPLSNTLLAGTVDVDVYSGGLTGAQAQKRVEALDLNQAAHDFLAAVERLLDPALVIPARRRRPATVKRLLDHKRTLAAAIASQVTHILAQTDDADISARRDAAAELLHQQLLINLVEAYDIETIIQYNVDVALAQDPGWTRRNAPRLYGQPVVRAVRRRSSAAPIDAALLDFTLSPGKIPLSAGQSYLTFFFNTKSPEKFEDLTLDLAYRVNELEHDIVDVAGVSDYQASSWLSFVLPIDQLGDDAADAAQNPNYIGAVAIPIPLRSYPIPPSLVLHAAEADPDSLARLQDIRQWQYTYVYEHLDIAQDTIETSVRYNVAPAASGGSAADRAAGTVPDGLQQLFGALVNFSTLYPQLTADLQGLASGSPAADSALDALETLIGRVADAWAAARIAGSASPSAVAQYTIDEVASAASTEVTITRSSADGTPPSIVVPGYQLVGRAPGDAAVIYSFAKKTPDEAAKDPVYGESSIPDRKLTFADRDIIEQQNAWGAIWLTRNKQLIPGRQTNPLFVYQTPQVRFANMVTPLLANTRAWAIDELGASDGPPQQRSLEAHVEALFATLLPASATQSYDIRVTCRYAFALAVGATDSDDLLSVLPVLLGPRFTIAAGSDMLAATADFRASMVAAISSWKERNKPLQTKGMYIFSVAIFSNLGDPQDANTNLPILRIDDLRLRLGSIVPGSE